MKVYCKPRKIIVTPYKRNRLRKLLNHSERAKIEAAKKNLAKERIKKIQEKKLSNGLKAKERKIADEAKQNKEIGQKERIEKKIEKIKNNTITNDEIQKEIEKIIGIFINKYEYEKISPNEKILMGNSAFRQFIFEECMEAEDLKKLNVNQIKRKVFIPSKALYIRIFLKAVEKGIL